MIGGVGASAETPTLYEWAGGREAIERLLNRFYNRVEDDELIAPLFGGKVSAEHRDHVATWWCEVLGAHLAAEQGRDQLVVLDQVVEAVQQPLDRLAPARPLIERRGLG